jgi:hypothetical protein
MPIEYEMKHLFEIVEHAIADYSEEHMCAYWFINIEDHVLRNLVEKNEYTLNYFKEYEVIAMRELIRRGLWLKWSDKENRPVLSPDPIYKLTIWDDTRPVPCGAD